MYTIAQRIKHLKQVEASLPQRLIDVGTEYGDTYVALVKEESIEKGINKDGKPGSKVNYSSKPLRSSSLMDAALNQAGRNYLKGQPTATYYGLRQAQGLRSSVVNLSYTGRSWQNFRVLSVEMSADGVVINIGVSGESAAIFMGNIKRYGPFYRATPEQRERLRGDMLTTMHDWLIV